MNDKRRICDECPGRDLCSGPPWCEYAEWPREPEEKAEQS